MVRTITLVFWPPNLMFSLVNFDVILSVMSNKELNKQLLNNSSDEILLCSYFTKCFTFYTHNSLTAPHVQNKVNSRYIYSLNMKSKTENRKHMKNSIHSSQVNFLKKYCEAEIIQEKWQETYECPISTSKDAQHNQPSGKCK